MKILMVNVCCGKGSTGRICTDLAIELERLGHTVKIAFARDGVDVKFEKYAVQIGTDVDVKLHALKARAFDAAGFGSKRATVRFIEWVEEYDPDVIHLHNIHGYYLNIEVLFNYLRYCGKKIIWTLHDCWAFTGHSAYCDAANCERWITGCHDCPNMKEYPASLVDRSKENWAKKKILMDGIPNLIIVTPSEWLARLVRKSFLAQYQVKVIHNGIDTSQFYPMENDTREFFGIGDKFMLLGVSTSWDEMKGYTDFLKLADMLGDEYQIVLVGLTKTQKEKLPKRIIGIERTNSVKELAQIYSSADLFLNLSYCENYPTVNIEATACGTPILTYKTGGSPESAGKEAIVVERGDVNAVANAIINYKNSGIQRGAVIRRSELDKEATVNSYTQIIGGGYYEYKNSLGILGKRILLGVASVWDKRKGLVDIIKLSEMTEEHIVVVGISEEQRKILPDAITAYTRTNNVDELRKLYAVADCFINPTYEDNFPTTNIEALACGTPVISYRTGGSPESATMVVEKGEINKLNSQLFTTSEYCVEHSKEYTKDVMLCEYMKLF